MYAGFPRKVSLQSPISHIGNFWNSSLELSSLKRLAGDVISGVQHLPHQRIFTQLPFRNCVKNWAYPCSKSALSSIFPPPNTLAALLIYPHPSFIVLRQEISEQTNLKAIRSWIRESNAHCCSAVFQGENKYA